MVLQNVLTDYGYHLGSFLKEFLLMLLFQDAEMKLNVNPQIYPNNPKY